MHSRQLSVAGASDGDLAAAWADGLAALQAPLPQWLHPDTMSGLVSGMSGRSRFPDTGLDTAMSGLRNPIDMIVEFSGHGLTP